VEAEIVGRVLDGGLVRNVGSIDQKEGGEKDDIGWRWVS
jgi:hypothetical protein